MVAWALVLGRDTSHDESFKTRCHSLDDLKASCKGRRLVGDVIRKVLEQLLDVLRLGLLGQCQNLLTLAGNGALRTIDQSEIRQRKYTTRTSWHKYS